METRGTHLYGDEALRFIEMVEDPITKNLLNMALVHLVKRHDLERHEAPRGDVDLLYLMSALKDYFAEHDVLSRTLAGEKVGAWFDDEMQPHDGIRSAAAYPEVEPPSPQR